MSIETLVPLIIKAIALMATSYYTHRALRRWVAKSKRSKTTDVIKNYPREEL